MPGVIGELPRVVLGASRLDRIPQGAAFRLLDAAVELGITAIDSATTYGEGRVDGVLGAWLASSGTRDRVMLLGKVGHPDDHGPRLRADAIAEDLARSLDRLGTDRLDVLVLHRDDEAIPVDEIVDLLDHHVRAGQASALGASNWSSPRLAAALAAADASERARFAITSPQLSLAVPSAPPWPGCTTLSGRERAGEHAFYASAPVTVLAWSPLGRGFLVGRTEQTEVYQTAANRARRARLDELAQTRGCSPAELALAYVLRAPFRTSAVLRAGTIDHLGAGARAIAIELSADERAWLEGG